MIMDKIELRKEAISRYLSGEKPAQIASALSKSKPWVYKWIGRYETVSVNQWYLSQSTVPKIIPNKIPSVLERQIIQVRKQLKGKKYSQIGALSIQYEFKHLGLTPPHIWTINRVLKRNNLVHNTKINNRKKKPIRSFTLVPNKWIWWGQDISKVTAVSIV